MDDARDLQTRFRFGRLLGVLITSACLSGGWAAAGQVRGPFYGMFQGPNQWDHTRCDAPSRFVYYKPDSEGPFPLAIFLTGTLGDYDGWEAHLNLQRLAARGYVAASPDYGQDHLFCAFSCYCYSTKADCVSDPDFSGSLVRVLERDAGADTSRGFVTWGHSQGGYVAVLAGNLNARVTRALATGTADPSGSYPCMEPGARRLGSQRIRFVIGESDEVTPPSQAADTPTSPGFISQLASLTEQPACAASGAYACMRPDGCGYYIVANREAVDGTADHRYFLDHQQDGDSPLSLSSRYRTDWRHPWSLDASVEWLTGACGDGVCSEMESVLTCSLDC